MCYRYKTIKNMKNVDTYMLIKTSNSSIKINLHLTIIIVYYEIVNLLLYQVLDNNCRSFLT